MKKLLFTIIIIASFGLVSGITVLKTGDLLSLNIPIKDMAGQIGKCQVDVIDPQDNTVGSGFRFAYISSNAYSLSITVRLKQQVEDHDLLRVRVRFKNFEKTYSLYQLQDHMIVKILGQNEFLKGTPINYRVIVTNQRNNDPIRGAKIKVTIKAEGMNDKIYTGMTNDAGTWITDMQIPSEVQGADLHFEVESNIGRDTYDTTIKLLSGNLTYLVTDKPIYQPGQTIHIRTLSLRKPDLVAVAKKELTFEVEDGKGNKVFKKAINTDDFGTGYVQFLLADELNFGDYTIRAILDGEKVEKTVKVQKYVLPKFKIELSTDREFYLPGATLDGTIDAQYFFGKPVVDGKVKITAYRYDIGFQKESELEGKTDQVGKYHFVYNLPDYFVGEPLEKGDAFVRLDIEVIDKANHSEKISLKKKVVQDVINLSIVPEGGVLKPKLENRIYVLANYPDGTPCLAQVDIVIDGKQMSGQTDSYGIAEFIYTPRNAKTEISVLAKDEKGEQAQLKKEFASDIDRDQIIMKMARGIYKVGESIDLQFLTTKRTGRVYLDIIKNNQTVLTKSVSISNGKGSFTLNLTPDLSGSVWFHAYIVTPGSDIVRATRFCYVHPAKDLLIDVKPDQKEYLPGGDGNILFTVTDQNGQPMVAVLCIAIVDEAVFAVSELQPGLEKIYFTLEKEIMEPRYEIHGFTPIDIVSKPRLQARAENLMFSTLEPKEPFSINYTTPQNVNDKIRTAFYGRLSDARDNIYGALNKYYAKHNQYPKADLGIESLIENGFLKVKDLLDPWQKKYRITTTEEYLSWFTIVSAGPDGIFDNADDLSELGWGRGGMEEGMMFKENRMAAPGGVAQAEKPMVVISKTSTDRAITGKELARLPASGTGKPLEEPRIREFFPETFIFEPALITDANGNATLAVTMPDAITTWRITTFASSQKGTLGSTQSGLRVFQDFFVDIDLPVVLTEGDEISIPVALYNYLPKEQTIKIVLQAEDWFEMLEKNEITKNLKKDEVSVVYFPIRIKKIGYYSILVKAYGEVKSDAIKRSIAILPDGKRYEDIISDRLTGKIAKNIAFSKNSINDANSLILRIFPGIYSQVVEGLDKMLGMPFGCFEQTSSVTYPNILILNYLRQTEQIKPETEMKAEEYISLGYQRLLSFEVSGGGFSWFGDAPANKILTAYGLMEFYDMSKVYEIDERVIERTAQWLKGQQNKDGSWSPDKQYLHVESWGKIQANEILPTAYIVWALAETGDKGDAVARGLKYLTNHLDAAKDPYILALIANAFVAAEPKSDATTEVLKKLIDTAKEENDAIYWQSDIPSITFTRGTGADIEATGLAAYALVKSGRYSNIVTKVLTYLIRSKDASGLWYTTQGTISALRSFVAALGGVAEDINAQILVTMNGKKVKDLKIDKSNADLMHQIDLGDNLRLENKIEIDLKGEGNFLYEIISSYYLPWNLVPIPEKPGFVIAVDYDRTKLVMNDMVNVDVSIRLMRPGTAQMVMVDLGIPPGFEVQTPTLDEIVGKKIQKYTLTPRQLIIYLDEVSSAKPINLSYSLKAKYPIKAKVASSRVYEYYNTTQEGIDVPFEMQVTPGH